MITNDRSRAADDGPAPDSNVQAGGHQDSNRSGPHLDVVEYLAGLHRRRAAASRCPPLDELGQRRDTLDPNRDVRWARVLARADARTDELCRQAWGDAVAHLRQHGYDVVGHERRAAG